MYRMSVDWPVFLYLTHVSGSGVGYHVPGRCKPRAGTVHRGRRGDGALAFAVSQLRPQRWKQR